MRHAPDLVALARKRLLILKTAEDTLAGKYDRRQVVHPLGSEPVRHAARPNVSSPSQASETNKTLPRECAPRLLMMLWRCGVVVDLAEDGAVRLTPPPYRPVVPGALLGACRRYETALAAWMGGNRLRLCWPTPTRARPMAPLCPDCATRRWWRPDPAAPWTCWRCEPPAVNGVDEWG